MRFIYVILLVTLVLQGCSSHSPQTYSFLPSSAISQTLAEQHSNWVGTPYKFGGNSRSGIDCSAFTQVTYQQRFGLNLPRTTAAQAESGKKVNKNQLEAGDLVFFLTGSSKQRHVGIYLENGRFLHASTSRGVMYSELSNPYWKKHYWKAVRTAGMARLQAQ